MENNIIQRFAEDHAWLSNFHLCPNIVLDGVTYPSVEHAYQASKVPQIQRMGFIHITAGQSKRLPHKLGYNKDDLSWKRKKKGIMRKLIRQKFEQGTELAEKLKATGDCMIVEGNTWGDVYWGVCAGVGENNLGKLIMQQRDDIKGNIMVSL